MVLAKAGRKHSETGVLIKNRGNWWFCKHFCKYFSVPARKKKIEELGKTESTLLYIKFVNFVVFPSKFVCSSPLMT